MIIYALLSFLIIFCSTFTGCTCQHCPSTDASDQTQTTRASHTIHLSSVEQFDKLIQQEKVVVDFAASWCAPCKQMSPIIDALAAEHTTITFIKVDVDQFKALAQRYNIMNIPTFIFFKQGQQVHQLTGVRSKTSFKQELVKIFG